MRSFMALAISTPAASSCSIRPCDGCLWKLDASNYYSGSLGQLMKVQQPFRCPPKRMRDGGVVALAAAPVRWTLDDVERISRGRPSKAKMGSRAVPHRLNAEERKAFELAKKRGYVVQQVNSRRYPLINTYRNYCDAIDFLCIRVEQGTTGLTDEVVIDFTPLHWSEADLSTLRAQISKAVMAVLAIGNDQPAAFEQGLQVEEECLNTKDEDDSSSPDNREESGLPDVCTEYANETIELAGEILRFQAPSRNMTKVISRTALDTWRK